MHGDSLLMLTTKVVSNKKPPLLSDSESGGRTSPAGQMLMIVLTGTLASVGTAGVPGAGVIMLALVLQTVGLPMEGLALVAGIDRVLDMIRTCLNITGDAAVTIAVSQTERSNN